jgi:hypothetical protein
MTVFYLPFFPSSAITVILFLNNIPSKEFCMKLNAPTQITFLISLALAALALLSMLGVSIPVVDGHVAWTALAGYAVLSAGNILKGW